MLFNLIKNDTGNWMDIIAYIVSALVVVFLVLPVHEAAHAWAASKMGDKTAKNQGRLTLNPFAHIDYIGAILLVVVGFGWAKPVSINPRNFKNPKAGMALSALAGPASNILVALILAFPLQAYIKFAPGSNSIHFLALLAQFLFLINIRLAVFNLIPIPPLDGSKILGALLPSKYYFKMMQYERYISIVLIALLLLGWLDIPLNFLSGLLQNILLFIGSLPFKLLG